MKSWRVWSELSSDENVWRAWRDLERGKRRRPDVAEFALDADRHVLHIAASLRSGRWEHVSYRLLRVSDPKRRLIAAASVPDRVVHHAIHRVLAPRYNQRFLEHSYACLPGRGTHRALLAWLGHARRYPWVLCLDIARYFYEIDRARLRALTVRAFPEPQLAGLLDRVLQSGSDLYRRRDVVDWLGWEAPQAPGRGLPIGNLTSQWWGNVYLDGLVLTCSRPSPFGCTHALVRSTTTYAAPCVRVPTSAIWTISRCSGARGQSCSRPGRLWPNGYTPSGG